MVELVDEAQRLVAQRAALALAQAGEILAQQADGAGAGRIEPAQQVQQGRLAGARGADDGDLLAADVDIDIASTSRNTALGEGLAQAPRRQHRLAVLDRIVVIIHSAGPPPV
jgi:hypothetical protein